jgi:hypothetical protein
MNIHKPILPTTTIVVPNMSILGSQAMNHNIGHTTIPINCKTTWSQLVTSIILGKTSVTYFNLSNVV